MTAQLTFDTASGPTRIELSLSTGGSWSSTRLISNRYRRVPLTIPVRQLYFWTALWQEAEGDAASDIAAGRVHTFEDPESAIRWLLSPSDD